MTKVIVYHSSYGCDTGCCGHVVELTETDERERSSFEFAHPYGEDELEFAKSLVRSVYGEEHVADLDWDNCLVSDN